MTYAIIWAEWEGHADVLRHEDVARLKAMCDRMGWQVVDGQASSNEH
jgi:hypothetical protein